MALKRFIIGLCALVFSSNCAAHQPTHHRVAGVTVWESGDLSRFDKWTGVLARIDRDPGVPAYMLARMGPLRQMPLPVQARGVNDVVNSFAYIEDRINWGRDDYWGAPREFFEKGGGDCEDFAIVKYALLRDLGVPEESMRVSVVYDRELERMHALLAVDTDDDTFFLDNQMSALGGAAIRERYHMIFSLGRQAWWLYGDANLL